MIDEKGRCCGRKPVEYKGGSYASPRRPQKFCCRCNKAYDLETNAPISNWAWDVKSGSHRAIAGITK